MRLSLPSSPLCLPTEHGAHLHLALLGVVLIGALACLAQSALPMPAQAVLACVALVYTGICAWRLANAPRAVLQLHGDAIHLLRAGGERQRVSAARWRDYGYLLVLYCRIDGTAAGFCWWCHALPAGQRRRLRLAMQAHARMREPPSLLMNPLL